MSNFNTAMDKYMRAEDESESFQALFEMCKSLSDELSVLKQKTFKDSKPEKLEKPKRVKELYFGDNWSVMQKLESNIVDLVCISPPHHPGKFDSWTSSLESMFSKKGWVWDQNTENVRSTIQTLSNTEKDYRITQDCLQGFDKILCCAREGKMGGIRDYLTFFCPRAVEMKRLLKNNGTLYYVGFFFTHYLKCFFDTLFEQAGQDEITHFKKEIIIEEDLQKPSENDSMWYNNHRISLCYAKGEKPTFNNPKAQRGSIWRGFGGRSRQENDEMPFRIKSTREIYDRWINVSTNPDDVVLDPFCGSGTTLESAQDYGRNWIGIDNADDAIQASIYRMWKKHSLIPVKDYDVIFEDGGKLEKMHALDQLEYFLAENELGINFSAMFDHSFQV